MRELFGLRPLVLAGAAIALAGSVAIAADAYESRRHVVAAGGAVSTGGGYSLTGTIGQADAGALTGGGFLLGGGFWTGAHGPAGVFLPIVSRQP
jgi:hypothetical protein